MCVCMIELTCHTKRWHCFGFSVEYLVWYILFFMWLPCKWKMEENERMRTCASIVLIRSAIQWLAASTLLFQFLFYMLGWRMHLIRFTWTMALGVCSMYVCAHVHMFAFGYVSKTPTDCIDKNKFRTAVCNESHSKQARRTHVWRHWHHCEVPTVIIVISPLLTIVIRFCTRQLRWLITLLFVNHLLSVQFAISIFTTHSIAS